MATSSSRAAKAARLPGVKRAAHDQTIENRPVQPSGPLMRPGKYQLDDKPEYDAFMTATDNRPPLNDLYERIRFLNSGKRGDGSRP